MRAAVVGHVEWVTFARVDRVPVAGEIVIADEAFEEPAGGGGVAAVQLARLAGGCAFYTALGDDELGRRSEERLRELGVEVHVAWRPARTRRAFVHLDACGERTITVVGERLVAHRDDPLPWDRLAEADTVYFTGGDAAAAGAARRARVLVATPRAGSALGAVEVDALVYSGGDADEVAWAAGQPARARVRTAGAAGGTWSTTDPPGEGAFRPVAPPSAVDRGDAYGCGDSFAAGLTFALGAGRPLALAVEEAARCGAVCRTGRGPYGAAL